MTHVDWTPEELRILEALLEDLEEAIADGDRPEFDAAEAAALHAKILAIKPNQT